MAYTGGELNLLNGKMGISAPHHSVPVMKLIKTHSPKSKSELVDLIEGHYRGKCECGIISKGTVEDFGRNLYRSQLEFWGYYKYSLMDCIQWEYDLFVVQSLKGGIIEKSALSLLREALGGYKVVEAVGFLDEDLRIDIVVSKDGKEMAGVQVKPKTFSLMRQEVRAFQSMANSRWGNPVFTLFYDGDSEFTNFHEVVDYIKKSS